MKYTSVIYSSNVIPGYWVMPLLSDDEGVYRGMVEIVENSELSLKGFMSMIIVRYADGSYMPAPIFAVANDNGAYDWYLVPKLIGTTTFGTEAPLTYIDVSNMPQFNEYITWHVDRAREFCQSNYADLSSKGLVLTYEEYFISDARTLNDVFESRTVQETTVNAAAEDVQTTEVVQDMIESTQDIHDSVQISSVTEQYSQPVEGLGSYETEPQSSDINEVQGTTEDNAEYTTPKNQQVTSVGAVDFRTDEVERNIPVATEPEAIPDTVKVEPVQIESVQDIPVASEPIPVQVEPVESVPESKDMPLHTAKSFNAPYKYRNFDITGLNLTTSELYGHGSIPFNAPVTDLEKFIIQRLSGDMPITYSLPPFAGYITDVKTFKELILECADAFKDGDKFRIQQFGAESTCARLYDRLCDILLRPTVLYKDVGSKAITESSVLREVSHCIGNLLEDMSSMSLRFLWILLQMDVPVYESYNGVYFSMYLCRLIYGMNHVYSKIGTIVGRNEEVLTGLLTGTGQDLTALMEYTVGDVLTAIDSTIMMSYTKSVLGFALGQSDDDDENKNDDDDSDELQFSWTIEDQINIGAVSFIENELVKNQEVIYNLMKVNDGFTIKDGPNGQEVHRLYDTVSELISSIGYNNKFVYFSRSELSFSLGVSMPDLKARFLDTKIEFMYRDTPLLSDVIFSISYDFNRTVNSGVEDHEVASTIANFWQIINEKDRILRLLFGLGTDANNNLIVDYNKIHISMSVLGLYCASVAADSAPVTDQNNNRTDSSSVVGFKKFCKSTFSADVITELYGDIDLINWDGTKRITMDSQRCLEILVSLIERSKPSKPGIVDDCMNRLKSNFEEYTSAATKQDLIKGAYALYDVGLVPAEAISDIDTCVAVQGILYGLAHGEDESTGEIPESMAFDNDNQLAIYRKFRETLPPTVGFKKCSFSKLLRNAKLNKIKQFKNVDTYRKARTLLSKLDSVSPEKRKLYDESPDPQLFERDVEYDVQYLVVFGGTMQFDPNTGERCTRKVIIEQVLGMLCKTQTNQDSQPTSTRNDTTLELMPLIGCRSLNTIIKHNYQFGNVYKQVSDVVREMTNRTPLGKKYLTAFMNSMEFKKAVTARGIPPTEDGCFEWLQGHCIKKINTPLDSSLMNDEVEIPFGKLYFLGMSADKLLDKDGNHVESLKLKAFDRAYVRALKYFTQYAQTVGDKLFTIRLLPINLIKFKDGEQNIPVYGVDSFDKPTQYTLKKAVSFMNRGFGVINTINLTLKNLTNNKFATDGGMIRLSNAVLNGDNLDLYGKPLDIWDNILSTKSTPDNKSTEETILSESFFSLLSPCWYRVNIK